MDIEQARVIVARQITHNALDSVDWEDYPEIGEYDWELIVRVARRLSPGDRAFNAAYSWLAERAGAAG